MWALFTGLFLLWLLSAPERTLGVRRAGVFFVTFLYLVAAIAIKRSAQRPDLPAQFRKGLLWIAGGLALDSVGGLYVLAEVLIKPNFKTAFSLADLLFLATYPTILMGFLSMPRVDRPSTGVGRLLVDSAVFITGVGLPLWFFAVGPGLATASGYEAALVVVYPLVTFAGITALNIVLLTRMPLPTRGAFRLLVIAVGVSWLADLLFLLDSVHGFIAAGPINWINVFNTLSIGLFCLAAGRIDSEWQPRPQAVQPAASSPLPIITIVVVSAWLLMFVVYGHPAPDALSRIFWCLALLFVILSVRETFVFRDNSRWLAAEVQRESRARFESLVRHSSDVIMVVDTRGAISFASPAAAVALGVPADSIVGQPILGLAHPEDASKGAEFLEQL
ncbi:MAG TPA: PAS domain-containing protein, partial [Opitutaceae bacterium]|nr:PAS domain-containing protein [Opitutaceae bacterium]